jgi:hypothetical protein
MVNAKILTDIFLVLKNQGLSFSLLALFAYYSMQQVEELRGKVDSCFETQIEKMEQKNQEYLQIIERNTQALERLTFIIKEKK